MRTQQPIVLIDPNSRSRASFVHSLAQVGRHAEPYEDAAELKSATAFAGVFIASDTGDLIEQVIATLNSRESAAAVIAYSDKLTASNMLQAIRAGAIDYLDGSNFDCSQLLAAIHSAEQTIERDMMKRIRVTNARRQMRALTFRERQVLELIAAGSSSREIGETLGISPRTVEIHRANMQIKLCALNSPHAVRIGLDAGLIN